jgi:hypothetical protein
VKGLPQTEQITGPGWLALAAGGDPIAAFAHRAGQWGWWLPVGRRGDDLPDRTLVDHGQVVTG